MGWYVVILVTLNIAYLCKKLDESSFSYSWNAYSLKILSGSRDVITPIPETVVVRRLRLAMINLRIKFEVSTITCNEDYERQRKNM